MTRNSRLPAFGRSLFTLLLVALSAGRTLAQELAQTFTLQPGWNAVWLEVDPPDRTPSVVFAGLPVASVWTWSERVSATDFIQNPETTGWNRAQWLAHFPPQSPEARLANLYAVLPQRAYLVRIAASNAVNWVVRGKPTLRFPDWVADRFNLRGFPIDDAAPPTFRQFFRTSPAHYTAASSQLQPIYRLNGDGEWRLVEPGDRLRRGEAYWVFSRGPSDFIAPFRLSLNSGEHLAFDGVLRRIELTLRNACSGPKSIRIEPAGPYTSPLMLLPPALPGRTNAPSPLVTHDQPLAAGSAHTLRLGLDRTQLASSPATNPQTGAHTNLLRVSDGEGTQFYLGIMATATASDFSGLWLGSITITNVSPTLGNTNGPGTPGGVGLGFPLRLLLHVDSGGQVSLLRDVTMVYSRNNLAAGTNAPAAYVRPQATSLITDPARLVRYSDSDLRSGAIRGRRLTSPHFEFARTNGQFTLALTGVFGLSNIVSGRLLLPGDVPTNPFLHRYHPDHGTNAFTVTRDINLLIGVNPNLDPGEGDEVLGGTYWETLSGLHRLPLYASGSVELRRLSDLGELNANTP